MSENYHIPLDQLDPEVKKLIPPEDNILYTTRADVIKTGWGGDKKFGTVVVTDNGIAYRGKKMGFWTASIVSAARGAIEGYAPYPLIYEFKNMKSKIRIKHTLPGDPKSKRGFIFAVERCKEVDEPKSAYKERKKEFGAFVEKAYQQKIQMTQS